MPASHGPNRIGRGVAGESRDRQFFRRAQSSASSLQGVRRSRARRRLAAGLRLMNQSDRIEQVLQLVLALASGDLDARLDTGTRTEPIDGVIAGLNMLAEELSAS